MDIGFIGLGNMGFHMARRLIEAGHTVIALDTRREALDRIVALGGQPVASPKDVADRAETVKKGLASECGLGAEGERAHDIEPRAYTGIEQYGRAPADLRNDGWQHVD